MPNILSSEQKAIIEMYHPVIEAMAKAICIADAHDWASLTTTYHGRQQIRMYKTFALAAYKAIEITIQVKNE